MCEVCCEYCGNIAKSIQKTITHAGTFCNIGCYEKYIKLVESGQVKDRCESCKKLVGQHHITYDNNKFCNQFCFEKYLRVIDESEYFDFIYGERW